MTKPKEGDLSWDDLVKGDKVYHHEYGSGVIVDSSATHRLG